MAVVRYKALTNQQRYLHHQEDFLDLDHPDYDFDNRPFDNAVAVISESLEPGEEVVGFWHELDWPSEND